MPEKVDLNLNGILYEVQNPNNIELRENKEMPICLFKSVFHYMIR